MNTTTTTALHCATWFDHEWDEGRVVESGRDPVVGAFSRWRIRCYRCGRQRTETRRAEMPSWSFRSMGNKDE